MSSESQPRTSPTVVLVIVCTAAVLASLDLFIVNVALPQIGRDLHTGPHALATLSWVLNAYAIVFAALLVLFGRLAERYRRDRAFLVGVATFVGASAGCGLASSIAMLIAFRVVQAAGAALLIPTSLGLVLTHFPPDRRHGAVRAWTAAGGLAAALGPVVGGVLVAVSWRTVFFVNLPIGGLALLAGARWLPATPGQPVPRPDLTGAALITGGIGAVTVGLVEGNSWGWGSARTVAMLAAGTLALVAFARYTARHPRPLIDRALFALRPFTGAAAVAVLFSAAFGAMLLSRVLWAQDVWHWSALDTGLAIAPGPLMVPLFSFGVAGRLIARYGAGAVIAAGCVVFAAGAAWWALAIGLRPDYVGEMLGGMVLTGIGVGLTLPTFMASGAAALPAPAFATGSAVINMLRQIGMAIGIAALIALLGSPHSPLAVRDAYARATLVVAAVALAAGLAGALLLRRPRQVAAPAAAPVLAPEL